ncbi:23S rRNA (uracil(1939)-C(5))-methyltransferase RlmD [Clostridium botulinum]|uniref:23S rRNA (Uracil-5-)-methyltransferase RumA n=1 Tax=Clostridium botulinum (strain Langeland / NCTC 10281 / Type F) TaxID=441772 RepID=A7GH80_CLOBL|nr:23S rRNA (uracil(1939)-C(5))-methyltransferase RlmD [Clostridium botulinum]ABS40820.1 23S rRNA (uracil-5-)-methyltransferase RumA [Clostridium botulinum F str. Langeland]ADG00523.1 23S rRNA (uracil-5-)-methyltransferase RumA [Clostridium botulinum F str. 230613]KKM40981.1 RNA methyltransferase [Clostridium botulinum]MBY6792529.1 23S rRNA (uracil(1939)-C(5))-methyltransferase RlmD [Clostridium botulinum]MBY6937829.1 23S rRNA (uracil(1939)-C(5))-methyltransferase RlmD [Clostridium botulinum]
MRKGKEYEFLIEETEFPGTGVAQKDGVPVYIKGTVPGQKVLAKVTKKRREYAQAKLLEIIENIDYAIENKCPHFGQCGGCSTQYIPYEKQLQIKEEQLLKLFKSKEIKGFDFLGVEKSPEEYEYRNKMEFTFGDMEKGGDLTLGMHVKNRNFSIVTVDNCEIVDRDFRNILTTVVNYFNEKRLPKYRVMSHEGFLRNLVIRKAKNTGEILINIVTTSQMEFDFKEIVDMLLKVECKGEIKGILHTINDTLSDVVQVDKLEILYGRDYIIEELLGLKFKIAPEAFFQTNSKGAEKLYSIVKDFLGDASSKVVFDLYCGTGTIGQIVAPKAKKVIGVELIEEAVKAANENAKLNGLNNCEFIAGDVAKVIKDVKQKPDIIILDPPRPGVHPVALEYVVKFEPKEIIYVSCNPKTLVDDLKYLIDNGYKLEKVKGMDMFPHTPHTECVTRIERVKG